MNLKPLYDRIVVRRIPAEKTGGIVVPDASKEKPQEAEVVAVGGGRLIYNAIGDRYVLSPMPVGVGDRVLVGRYTGMDYKHEGVEYTIIREDDVLAVILPKTPESFLVCEHCGEYGPADGDAAGEFLAEVGRCMNSPTSVTFNGGHLFKRVEKKETVSNAAPAAE